MRLLNAHTRRFEEFYGEVVPAYAILSHTWEKEEVIYSDMVALQKDQSSDARDKEGFRKITLTCRQALNDGFMYVWIDTCCIDKSSSTELSEAINSMFDWYQRATVCYAYLADVPADFEATTLPSNVPMLSDNDLTELLKSTFATSRWFTRGWTLQELIAPSEVKFYNESFRFIGTRESLAYVVHHITGIDETLLLGEQSVSAFCVARKMSWAAIRKTTRVEDVAYSLFGIFDVNLPLLYGEGMRAFQRLQEEIIRTCDDQSILAWEPEGEGQRTILAPRPFNFANCGKLVRWTPQGASKSTPPIRTKFNLQLPLARFGDMTSTGQWAVLIGCRYEDNLEGPIGLRLQERVFRKQRYTLVQKRPYLVVVPSSLTHIQGDNPLRGKIVSIAEIYEPKENLERAISLQRNQKCWVRFVGNDNKFRIVGAYPPRHWNMETNVFIPSREKKTSAGAHFKGEDGMEFLLTFGYLREQSSQTSSSFRDVWVYLTKPKEECVKEQLKTFHSLNQHDRGISQLRLQGEDTVNTIEASISETQIMGEMIFLINMKIREGKYVRRIQSGTGQHL